MTTARFEYLEVTYYKLIEEINSPFYGKTLSTDPKEKEKFESKVL